MKKEQDIVCGVDYIHEENVKKAQKKMPVDLTISSLADIFKVLGDPTRLKIVLAISYEELCVCDLSALIGVSVSAISHQLRLLRSNRIVKSRRDGKMIYYSLSDEHINQIIQVAKEHVEE